MKRILFVLLVCFVYSCTLFDKYEYTCNPRNKEYYDFVYIDGDNFKIGDTVFFPLMVNYKVEPIKVGNEVVISPARYYELPMLYEAKSKDSILYQVEGHLQMIKEMGFNTIRVCMDVVSKDGKGYYYYSDKPVYLRNDCNDIIKAVDDFLNMAKSKGIRVMLLIKPPLDDELMDFTISLLGAFSDNSTLFCYDFMNEPLYFDPQQDRKKEDAFTVVSQWKDVMDKYAPHQLFTIGFSEPIEVFEWDPSILPVDFVQFHTYHPLRVPNEIWWYSHYVGKPWMIGETSFAVDNDSVGYEMQTYFMREVFQYALNCGAAGFGWWEFQDSYNVHFEAEFSGLINHEGNTCTNDDKYSMVGTMKPAAYEVGKLKSYIPQKEWQAVNYYNMLGYNNVLLKGVVLEKGTNKPIEGAVVRGWNNDWSVGLNTYTNKEGVFTLYSNDVCTHFEISAPGMTKIKFDKELDYIFVDTVYTLDNLPNRKLEYHNISYKPFLINDTQLLQFDSTKFSLHKMEGSMPAVYLEAIY